jgi:peroxiredoxin family protein
MRNQRGKMMGYDVEKKEKLTMVVFSGDLDKHIASLIMATGAAAMGMGTAMIKAIMKKKNVASLDDMAEIAGQLGVKIIICEMTMDLMGFKLEEMLDYPNLVVGGVATFLAEAGESSIQLFI